MTTNGDSPHSDAPDTPRTHLTSLEIRIKEIGDEQVRQRGEMARRQNAQDGKLDRILLRVERLDTERERVLGAIDKIDDTHAQTVVLTGQVSQLAASAARIEKALGITGESVPPIRATLDSHSTEIDEAKRKTAELEARSGEGQLVNIVVDGKAARSIGASAKRVAKALGLVVAALTALAAAVEGLTRATTGHGLVETQPPTVYPEPTWSTRRPHRAAPVEHREDTP